jgi:hypothetical protein
VTFLKEVVSSNANTRSLRLWSLAVLEAPFLRTTIYESSTTAPGARLNFWRFTEGAARAEPKRRATVTSLDNMVMMLNVT